MACEQSVLAIENKGSDAPLDAVRVEFDAAVVEEADEPFPVGQTVTQVFGKPRA